MQMKKTNNLCFFALSIIMLMPAFVGCQEKQRRPSRYLIPEGYVGWVKIYFKVKDAPALPVEDGCDLFKFSETGILKTSSEMETGWARDEYFYYSGDARRALENTGWDGGMIWAGYAGQSATATMGETSTRDIPEKNKTFYEGFFVGTEAEYKDYGRYDDEKAGRIDKQVIEQKKKDY